MKMYLISALPFISLLPRAAWEKVAEGRMRALSRNLPSLNEYSVLGQRALTRPSGTLSHCFATGEGGALGQLEEVLRHEGRVPPRKERRISSLARRLAPVSDAKLRPLTST